MKEKRVAAAAAAAASEWWMNGAVGGRNDAGNTWPDCRLCWLIKGVPLSLPLSHMAPAASDGKNFSLSLSTDAAAANETYLETLFFFGMVFYVCERVRRDFWCDAALREVELTWRRWFIRRRCKVGDFFEKTEIKFMPNCKFLRIIFITSDRILLSWVSTLLFLFLFVPEKQSKI